MGFATAYQKAADMDLFVTWGKLEVLVEVRL
jgi:hypothetical protein